jgi:hypothetical protein
MSTLMRIMCSGMLGLLIVLGIFMLMHQLLRQDAPNGGVLPSVDLATIEVPQDPVMPRLLIAVEKPRRALPEQQAVPVIETTTVSSNTTTGTELADNLAAQAHHTVSGMGTTSEAYGFGSAANDLDTHGMMKIYDHGIPYPKAALAAGIRSGELKARAVFDQDHRFMRFEIFSESSPEYFRKVLFQMKFVHTKHQYYHHLYLNQTDAVKWTNGGIHNDTYHFVFDLDSAEPVRMYVAHCAAQSP